jgi:hypothetical protein
MRNQATSASGGKKDGLSMAWAMGARERAPG